MAFLDENGLSHLSEKIISDMTIKANDILTQTKNYAVAKTGDTMTGNLVINTRSITGKQPAIYLQGTRDTDTKIQGDFFVDVEGTLTVGLEVNGTTTNQLVLEDDETTLMKPLTVASGGTGAITAEVARANLAAQQEWTIIWTNSAPTSGMSEQTLTISGLSNYNLFIIVCRAYYTSSYTGYGFISPVGYVPSGSKKISGYYCESSNGAYYIYERGFTVNPSENTVKVGKGWYGYSGNTSNATGTMIPQYILATKI